jgi:hypothetical protein
VEDPPTSGLGVVPAVRAKVRTVPAGSAVVPLTGVWVLSSPSAFVLPVRRCPLDDRPHASPQPDGATTGTSTRSRVQTSSSFTDSSAAATSTDHDEPGASWLPSQAVAASVQRAAQQGPR